MTTKSKKIVAAAVIGWAVLMWLVIASPWAHQAAAERRTKAAAAWEEHLAEHARESERTSKIAEEKYGDLWEQDDRSRQTALGSLWVYDLSPEFLRAETFGETLHVTASAEFSRGWLIYPCSGQREVMSDLFIEWKRRNASAHTVKLFNPGGGEIGSFSRLWGYHCGG